ncbi:hypothetical protein [Spiroplasma endosymbiont of Labia minor]|uniref:hypothetical protein n=1 Tax=Spiroplasma endosymbiont of Labia minor TaxID=3066305 RepID=UPI0030D166C4
MRTITQHFRMSIFENNSVTKFSIEHTEQVYIVLNYNYDQLALLFEWYNEFKTSSMIVLS